MKLALIDMDGVLADFIGGISKFTGVPLDPWPIPGKWDFVDFNPEFKNIWDKLTYNFWANLEVCKGAVDLISQIEEHYTHIFVCTTPPPSGITAAMKGKVHWLQKNFPNYSHTIIFSKAKYELADKNVTLYDDGDHNLIDFLRCNGNVVRVNRPWNSGCRETSYVTHITNKSQLLLTENC